MPLKTPTPRSADAPHAPGCGLDDDVRHARLLPSFGSIDWRHVRQSPSRTCPRPASCAPASTSRISCWSPAAAANGESRRRVARHGARRSPTRSACRCSYVPFKTPGELADQAGKNVWDIGNIGAEPQRAAVIDLHAAYCRDRGDLHGAGGLADQIDRRGRQEGRAHRRVGPLGLRPVAREQHQECDADPGQPASTAPSTSSSTTRSTCWPGCARACSRTSTKVPGLTHPRRQVHRRAAGGRHAKKNSAGAEFLAAFVEEAKKSGLVASLIEKHKVKGLSVAPPA